MQADATLADIHLFVCFHRLPSTRFMHTANEDTGHNIFAGGHNLAAVPYNSTLLCKPVGILPSVMGGGGPRTCRSTKAPKVPLRAASSPLTSRLSCGQPFPPTAEASGGSVALPCVAVPSGPSLSVYYVRQPRGKRGSGAAGEAHRAEPGTGTAEKRPALEAARRVELWTL